MIETCAKRDRSIAERRRRAPAARRLAFTLVEVTVCAVAASALLVLVAQMTLVLRRHAVELRQREIVLLYLENILEESSLLPWDGVGRRQIRQLDTWKAAANRWPNAALTVDVSDDAELAGKMLELQLDPSPQEPKRPVRLAGWIVPAKDEEPRQIGIP